MSARLFLEQDDSSMPSSFVPIPLLRMFVYSINSIHHLFSILSLCFYIVDLVQLLRLTIPFWIILRIDVLTLLLDFFSSAPQYKNVHGSSNSVTKNCQLFHPRFPSFVQGLLTLFQDFSG